MNIGVEDFRKLALYKRSIDLRHEVNKCLEENRGLVDKRVENQIRDYVTTIPRKIAYGMGQTNIKIRFKKLNEAKNILLQLQLLLRETVNIQGIVRVEDYSFQVLKLFNYYFGQTKRKKSNKYSVFENFH